MEGRKMKVFGVVMTLLLVFSFAATFSVSSTVSAGTQKWTKLTVPNIDDKNLAPLTDIGAIAVSPDGGTIFAAVVNESTLVWQVYKSIDGGYTWKNTGFAHDGFDIVAIKISPDWVNDDRVYVATQDDVYSSNDRGKTFTSRNAHSDSSTPSVLISSITSMDVGLDADGDAVVVIGSDNSLHPSLPDVYILSEGGWDAQGIYYPTNGGYGATTPSHYGVLSVAFSPNYGEDGVVFAVIRAMDPSISPPQGTYLRAESDIKVNNWGSYINDAPFMDQKLGINVLANGACISFPEDYNSAPSVFVGLIGAYGADYPVAVGTTGQYGGDAFRVDLTMGVMGTSAVTDLNIRGEDSSTSVNSLQVSGSASSAFILAGLRNLSNTGAMTSWQGQVHYSQNGGETWLQAFKPPSGLNMNQICAPIVVMAPDFAESGIAYCSNGYIMDASMGYLPTAFSGFYVSTTEGTTWNGRGLLDHDIDRIEDISVSPDYDNDSTLFMVTNDNSVNQLGGSLGFLWESKDGGSHWELILGMTLMIPLPGVDIDTIRIPFGYPTEPSLFVTGVADMGGTATGVIVRSTDEGNLFATTLKAPYIAGVAQVISAWAVVDEKTLIVASANRIWKTTDMGAHWAETDDTEIGSTEGITDLKIYKDTNTVLVGTNQSKVYICTDWDTDFTFTQVGRTISQPSASGRVFVAFDNNFEDNSFVYAGVDTATLANDGIWRIDANSGTDWDNIYDTTAAARIVDIVCDGNGIVWAVQTPTGAPPARNVVRSVNPNEVLPENVLFEVVDYEDGLATATTLTGNMETAPTNTYVFAVGAAGGIPQLWAYIDTLIKPTLIVPADGTTAAGTIIQGTSTARVSLMWDDLAKAQCYEYEVAYDDGFGSIATSGNLSGTQVAVNLFLGEKFYWRIRVCNNSPVISQWSETWSFTTPLGPASVKPLCLFPTEGETAVSLTPALQWSSAVEASGFELVVAANCDWSNAIINLTGSSALGFETAYQVTQSLQQGTNYCWKVRAVNEDTATNSPWSDTGTFTTLVIPAPVEEGTPVWVWVVIALSAVLLVGVVVLIVRTRRPV
jgi:hypothetical protein